MKCHTEMQKTMLVQHALLTGLLFVLLLGILAGPAFGQTVATDVQNARANNLGGYDLNLYYNGSSHITHITARGSLSGSSGNARYKSLRDKATSWTMTSSDTSVAEVATPTVTTGTSGASYFDLYPTTTLHIPAGYKTATAGCVNKISGSEEVFEAKNFTAGLTGDCVLQIGGRTANWGISTDMVASGTYRYYNEDLEYRISLAPIDYQIYFLPGEGTFEGTTGGIVLKTVTYQSQANNTPGIATREGYRFDGWTKADGTPVFDADGRWVAGDYWSAGGAWTWTDDLAVFAQWTKTDDFSFDHTVSGIEFDAFTAGASGTASYDFSLTDGQKVLFPGLPDGTEYQINEAAADSFKPSYQVGDGASAVSRSAGRAKAGQSLSTRRESLSRDTSFAFLNTQEAAEGTNLTLRKELAGNQITNADRTKQFTFNWMLEGLDPGMIYSIDMSSATTAGGNRAEDLVIAPDASGKAGGTLTLHGGEEAVFRDLPEGTRYALGETGDNIQVNGTGASAESEYACWYRVTDGEESTDTDYRFWDPSEAGQSFASDEAVGTGGFETLQEGMPVEIVFTNAKYDRHDLTFGKDVTVDGLAPSNPGNGSFRITAELTGLEPRTGYHYNGAGQILQVNGEDAGNDAAGADGSGSGGSGNGSPGSGTLTSDEAGTLSVTFAFSAGDRFTLSDLPGSMRCTLTEAACSYVPSITVTAGGDTVLEETGENGSRFSAGFDGLKDDTVAIVTNDQPLHNDLTVRKEFDGVFDRAAETAQFTVYLTGLEPAESYDIRKFTDDGTVADSASFTPETDGTYTCTFRLKDTESVRLLRLPAEATYRIEEAASPKASPSYVLTSAETEDIAASSGHAGKGEALSTETERMSAERSYSFYNCIVTEPVKTVADDDEPEGAENEAASLESSWIYHIHQDVDVPVSSFCCYDTLPPYVRTSVYDEGANAGAGAADPVFRVLWHSADGNVTRGGAVSDRDEETGEYYVRDAEDPETILFSICYDENTGEASVLQVTAEDESMLRDGGSFDLYFRGFIDPAADHAALAAEDCFDGIRYRFINEASTDVGGYLCDASPVVTHVPGPMSYRDLILQKKVTGSLGDRTKAFAFAIRLNGLDPGQRYETLADPSLPASAVHPFTADNGGNALVEVTLRDDEAVILPGIPEGASYQITEAASDHVASYEQRAEAAQGASGGAGSGQTSGASGGTSGGADGGEQPAFVCASASNGSRPNRSLQTEQETVGEDWGTIRVTFRNNRDLAVITGVPGADLLGLAGILVLLLGGILWFSRNISTRAQNG